METTYRMTKAEAQAWCTAAFTSRRKRERSAHRTNVRRAALKKATQHGASVVTIETPTGVIVDTLEVKA